MEPRSLGTRTDLMIRGLGDSEIEDRGDHVIVRTPNNPTFLWGNFIVLPEPPTAADVDRIQDIWRDAFPETVYCSILIDGADGRPGAPSVCARLGVWPSISTVQTATELVDPDDIDLVGDFGEVEFRPLDAGDPIDWSQPIELRSRTESDWTYFEPYTRRRHHEAGRVVRDGNGAWWGAFVDGVIRAELGVMGDHSGIARFQHVGTDPEFRRRGLVSKLVAHAGAWAHDELDAQTLVIVADPDGGAIRIYRRLGFRDTEWQTQLGRPGPPPA